MNLESDLVRNLARVLVKRIPGNYKEESSEIYLIMRVTLLMLSRQISALLLTGI